MMQRSLLPLLAVLAIGCATDTKLALPTPTLLSEAGANHVTPVYSPDGSRVAGWQRSGSGLQLWVADGDLGGLIALPVRTPSAFSIVWSPDGSTLATSQPGATTWSIVTVPAAGGEPTPVYSGTGLMFPIGWSADGSHLLVLETQAGGSYATQLVELATGTARPLLPGERRAHIASFAPVGRHAVVMIYDSARTTLWGLDSIGAVPRQLTTEGYEFPSGGVSIWSPDGQELVYESTRTGAPDLWVLDFATGASRQLTSDLRADRRANWSPDGEWILFESERGRQTDLWVVPAKGGDAIRLTDDLAIESAVGWRGRQVAYTVQGGSGSLHAVAATGGEERRLTADSIRVDYFEVSPDGSQIAFASQRSGSVVDIWVMPSGGGEARLVASPQAPRPWVTWSPDGNALAFIGLGGGTPDPWVLEVATGTLRQVLTWPSFEVGVLWGRDATELLVVSDRDSRFSDLWRVPLGGGEPVRLTQEGRVADLFATLDGGTRILASTLGGEGGRLGLVEVMADGTLRSVYSAQSVWSVAWGIPTGSDSIAAQILGDGGAQSSVMVSLTDGGTRPIGPPGTRVSYWSRSGTHVAFSSNTDQGSTIGVLELATAATRTISPGDGQDVGAEFLAGDSVVVFRRSRPENRIAVMDLTALLSRTP